MTRNRTKMDTNRMEALEERVAELLQWRQEANEQQNELKVTIEEKFRQQEVKDEAFRKSLLDILKTQFDEVQRGRNQEAWSRQNRESGDNNGRTATGSHSTPLAQNGAPHRGEGILPTPGIQQNVESDKPHYLDCCDCSRLNEEMERQRLDGNHKKNKPKEKLPDTRTDMALHHLPKRHIALKVMYFGQRFYGFASEAQMDPTIESEIFKALQKTRLISGDRKELHYSRCGRTDKGVSSVGQVISLFLRSNLKETAESNGLSVETFAEESCGGELDYVKILNRVLPRDIRIIGWSPAPTDFSSRFSCLSREYKYFFWRGSLNIMVMETAGEKFIGEHDFRNFCKMDAANVHNHRRHITSFEIVPCNERFEDDELWAVRIKGSAFLWHQIRCMVAVLFFIGQGLESPNVIDELLDVERTPRKPQYLMAPEIPLVLRSCEFDALRFRCSSDARQALLTHLEQECRSYKLQAAIFHEALLSSSCVSYEYDQLKGKTKKKEASHIALMSRPTEPSYDERCAKLNAGAGAKK